MAAIGHFFIIEVLYKRVSLPTSATSCKPRMEVLHGVQYCKFLRLMHYSTGKYSIGHLKFPIAVIVQKHFEAELN